MAEVTEIHCPVGTEGDTMKNPAQFVIEPFTGFTGEETGATVNRMKQEDGLTEQEVNRDSKDYVRWVQQTLNRLLGLRLAIDGVIGPATRSAIRSFQQKQGLLVDGIVGPRTEAALWAALGGKTMSTPVLAKNTTGCETLEGFDFDRDQLKPDHQGKLIAVAKRVIQSRNTSQPIQLIQIVGHTDPVGTDAYNLALGQRRAAQASRALRDTIERIKPGSSRGITFEATSRGETQQVSVDPVKNRRVEICLPQNVAPPVPVPPVPPPTPIEPPPAPPNGTICDSDGRRFLTGGIWNKDSTLAVRGGQGMNFVLKNLNVLGTTIRIKDHFNQTKSRIIPPLGEATMLFTAFGAEPMGWQFEITTNSDVFLVGWKLCSTWIPGDSPNR